jgi:neutral ceramidase
MRLSTFTIALFLLASTARAASLRVGAAAVLITPEAGTPMAGYYTARAAEGVHDDLYAKAIVLEQDGVKAALVACDLISMPRGVVERAREQVERETHIPGSHVMISATHSHTGPVLTFGSSRDPAEGDGRDKSRRYTDSLPGLIAQSVKEADGRLAPASASVGVGREAHLSFNRRYFMRDGTVGWNPGKLNPKILRPAGPIDPEVPVVYFESAATGPEEAKGGKDAKAAPNPKPIATYVNFAMHLDTTGGLQISADYAFTLSKLLGRVKSPDMVTLFTIGTAGDINHIDVSTKRPQQGPQEAARIGTILAGETIKTYARLEPVPSGALRVRSEMVKLDLPPVTADDIAKARKDATTFGKNAPTFLEKVNAFKVLDVAAREGKPQEVEVQVIALGDDLVWVSMPGEIFVELGLAVKKDSPFRHTIIAELANGAIGYIPTRRAFAEGNYEPVSARCAAGSGERLVETALKLLKEAKEGTSR